MNEQLDLFVNSILASINQSIPDLIEKINQPEIQVVLPGSSRSRNREKKLR